MGLELSRLGVPPERGGLWFIRIFGPFCLLPLADQLIYFSVFPCPSAYGSGTISDGSKGGSNWYFSAQWSIEDMVSVIRSTASLSEKPHFSLMIREPRCHPQGFSYFPCIGWKKFCIVIFNRRNQGIISANLTQRLLASSLPSKGSIKFSMTIWPVGRRYIFFLHVQSLGCFLLFPWIIFDKKGAKILVVVWFYCRSASPNYEKENERRIRLPTPNRML